MRIMDVKAGFAHCQIVIGDVVTIVDVGDATVARRASRAELAPAWT